MKSSSHFSLSNKLSKFFKNIIQSIKPNNNIDPSSFVKATVYGLIICFIVWLNARDLNQQKQMMLCKSRKLRWWLSFYLQYDSYYLVVTAHWQYSTHFIKSPACATDQILAFKKILLFIFVF